MRKKKLVRPKQFFSKLYTWSSLERDWEPRGRAWYVIYSFFFTTIIFCTVILEQYFLTLAVISFVFLWFTHASVKPDKVTHTITSLGIKTFGKLYKWNQIKHFWISEKNNKLFLNLEIVDPKVSNDIVRTLSLLMNPEDEENVFFNLIKYVDYGDKEEIGYNIFTNLIHGKYKPITNYIEEWAYTQSEYLEKQKD
ncbi:MAG: hypothetical protein KatS3mg085_206 [Candidatus Dojkabacteria bacterium]|nr:MAG: hypothetical protein KatS3mg085_206 [Candidatus Dojkabacteria bacterium]